VKEIVTPKQVARAIGVSESSLKRWCDEGLLPVTRTAGGHRRLPIHGVLRFLRDSGRELVDPGVLGLPRTSGTGERVVSGARGRLRDALIQGDETIARQVVIDLYLAGVAVHRICDEVIAGAFEEIGNAWACEEIEVYQERRGCEIVLRVLFELRALATTSNPNGPIAIGGTTSGDNYVLPTTIVEVVLREVGWNATSLGTELPFATLERAVERVRPRLFWLSVAVVDDVEAFVVGYEKLYTTAASQGTAVVIGGRALVPELLERLRFTAHCEKFGRLVDLARSLVAPEGPVPTA
jgi:MerR family transcriptional regulator, light-induced transcriptional regulator